MRLALHFATALDTQRVGIMRAVPWAHDAYVDESWEQWGEPRTYNDHAHGVVFINMAPESVGAVVELLGDLVEDSAPWGGLCLTDPDDYSVEIATHATGMPVSA